MGTIRRDICFVLLLFALAGALLLLPSAFHQDRPGQNTASVQADILAVDNSDLRQCGIVRTGDQTLRIRIKTGPGAGQELDAVNHLMGRLEFDKVFAPGDRAFAVLSYDGNTVVKAQVLDHYRLDTELAALGLFSLLLLGFAGWTGAKALLSFIFTALMLWKVLLPGMLRGWDPLVLSLGVVAVLTAVIIFLVGGIGRRGGVAFLGALGGIAVTCLFALAFGARFSIHGAVKPFAETLLYSGFAHLDLTRMFLGGIFLASSGAVMDLAMDVAAAQHEIAEKHPGISRGELLRSGFTVGRAVVGTMTTTLLLAYTGSFLTLLLTFVAQGIPWENIFNMPYVAAEILNTLAGSFGLVTVAPLTALAGSLLFVAPPPRKP